MPAKWEKFSKEEIEEIVKESRSFRDVAIKLGYKSTGGSAIGIAKDVCSKFKLDTSHFKGQGWNKGNYDYSRFQANAPKKNGSLKKALVALRGRKCEKCGATSWLGQPINLEVHHISGNRTDNSFDNLQLLCSNCHSYTPTFARKTSKMSVSEDKFVEALKNNENIHRALISLGLTPAAANYERARKLVEKYKIEHLY